MNDSLLEQLFSFATTLEAFKKMERFKGQFYWRDYPPLNRYESDADHSWRLAMLLILFEKHLSQPIQLERAIKMALVHDLAEIITGDDGPSGEDGTGKNTYAFNQEKRRERADKEKIAFKKLVKELPADTAQELFDLWQEYEDTQTFEAKVVRSLDKLEAILQVWEYRHGHLYKEHMKFNREYVIQNTTADPAIHDFAIYVLNKMQKNFKEFKKE